MTDAETMSRVSKALDAFKIEIPSWGFANTGTRFGKFVQQGAATTIEEKFADAGMLHRGYVVRAPDGTYRNAVQPKKLKFGFAGRSVGMPFSQEVSRSIRLAAADSGVELVELDNHYDAETAIRNAEEFIRSGVDVILEFNVEQAVAAIIGDKVAAAQVPFIAIDIPHPNATFFGVDNYRVGVEAGEVLSQYALDTWKGTVKWVLGLELPEAGFLVQARVTGAFDAVRAALPHLPAESFVRLDGRGLREGIGACYG